MEENFRDNGTNYNFIQILDITINHHTVNQNK